MKIFTYLRKKAALNSMIAAALLLTLPTLVYAGYAPSGRQTYTCVSPTNCPGADHVQFNSFTNAPNYGDERAFFDGKQAGSSTYQDNVAVQNGQKLTLRVYVHNNADPNKIGEAAAVAKNARLQVILPTSKKTTNQAAAQIAADNASPGSVSDTVDFTGTQPFTVEFDTASSVQVTYRPNGTGEFVTRTLPSAAFANASTLNANFGDFKGCFNFASLVTMTVIVKMDQTPPPPPPPVEKSFTCTALNVVMIDRSRYTFTAVAATKNVTIQNYAFTVQSAGKTVDTKTVTTAAKTAEYQFNQTKPGTYIISVIINTDSGATDPNTCKQQITIPENPTTPPPPPVVPPAPITPASTPPTVTAQTPGVPTSVVSLPDTGPGDVAAIAALVTLASTVAFSVLSRRF